MFEAQMPMVFMTLTLSCSKMSVVGRSGPAPAPAPVPEREEMSPNQNYGPPVVIPKGEITIGVAANPYDIAINHSAGRARVSSLRTQARSGLTQNVSWGFMKSPMYRGIGMMSDEVRKLVGCAVVQSRRLR